MQPICGTEAENLIDRSNKEGNLPVLSSGQITNLMEDDMVVLRCIGIKLMTTMILHHIMFLNSNSNRIPYLRSSCLLSTSVSVQD